MAIDLKDAYFHVSIYPRHRPFLHFLFEGWTFQYKVLPFGLCLSLSPLVFTKKVKAALKPLKEIGIRILNYLDDWLILANLEDQLCKHSDMVIRCLQHGLRCCVQRSKQLRVLGHGTPPALACQLLRVACSAPCCALVPAVAARQACTGLHGQHFDRCVHQPPV